MTGWHRPDVERSTLDHLAQVVGEISARQMVDGLIAKGRAQRDDEVAKLTKRVAELERQLTTARGAVAEAVMCDDVACLVNSHLPKVEKALGGLPLLPAEGGEPR
jgi:hypothetical protein